MPLKYLVILTIVIGLIAALFILKDSRMEGYAVYSQEGDAILMTLQNAGTENLADSYAKMDSPDRNYGTDTRLSVQWGAHKINSYIDFNISMIPEDKVIDSASLCLYLYDSQNTKTTYVAEVYSSWNELSLTGNNQPCKTVNSSTNCNSVPESYVQTDTIDEKKWQCWNVVNVINNNYGINDKVSFVIYTTSSGNENRFYSKEYSNVSLRPYLSILYHTTVAEDETAPLLTINSPLSENYSKRDISIDVSVDDDSGISSTWVEYNNENISYSNVLEYTFNEGQNFLTVYANDTSGNINTSTVIFNVDTIYPNIEISEPETKEYNSTSVPLALNVSDEGTGISMCWYNLSKSASGNFTNVLSGIILCSESTIINVPDGSVSEYYLSASANDYAGNTVYKEVEFNVSIAISEAANEPDDAENITNATEEPETPVAETQTSTGESSGTSSHGTTLGSNSAVPSGESSVSKITLLSNSTITSSSGSRNITSYITIQNLGHVSLTNCILKNEKSSLLISKSNISINPQAVKNLSFTLSFPLNLTENTISGFSISCDNLKQKIGLNIQFKNESVSVVSEKVVQIGLIAAGKALIGKVISVVSTNEDKKLAITAGIGILILILVICIVRHHNHKRKMTETAHAVK